MTRDARGRGRRLVRATAVLSASVLAFEIALMRVLLVASWHHFAFLVISLALLGFGVSGTVLALARPWLLRAPARWLFAIVLATAVAMVACTQLAQRIEVEAAIVPALLGGQVARWLLYWGLLTIPFLLGAAGIGLALMAAGDRIGAVYGANLLGSATGAIAAPGLMVLLPPAVLPAATALVALLAAVPLRAWTRPGRAVAWLAVTAGLAGWLLAERPHVRPDPWKDAALLARLQAQGSAWRIAMSHGPRSLVEAWGSDLFHDVPFAGPDTVPPPIAALVQDGHRTGAVLQVDSAAEAAVMDGTLMALPYELAPARPRVALLGATGGANAWLAVRRGASETLFVQPDGRLLEVLRLLRGPPAAPRGGAVLEAPSVRVAVAEPRHFVERPPGRFDVIQLVGLQGTAAGTGGVGGLGQDHLVTVEGLTACLEALTDDGVLFACRGIQTPPRDNVKLLATLVEALRRTGRRPGRHLVVVRDFLGVCTIARSSPWTADDLARVRAACAERQLTPVWFEGIGRDELNRPDALPGPEPGVDWYTEATRRLLSPEAASFIDAWAYDIRPPTDDRPFFHDFCRLGSLGALRDAYGDLWLTRTELAFLFVIAATGAVAVAGAVLILTPLLLLPAARRLRGRAAVTGYFAAIGLAYLLLEMTSLSSLGRLIGDPVLAAAVVIGGFLVFSGIGCLLAHRWRDAVRDVGGLVIAVLVAVAVLHVVALAVLAGPAAGWPDVGRLVAALGVIGPVATLMGFPMPMALARLQRSAAPLVPWAWGVNGFASVLAAPLAVAIGMTTGYRVAAIAAIALYAAAAWLLGRLPAR